PLVFPPGTAVGVHVVVAPLDAGGWRVGIYSCEDEDGVLHAAGRIAASPPEADPEAGRVSQSGERTEDIDARAYYEDCMRRGIEFGPRFQALDMLWRAGSDESGAHVRLPDGVSLHTAAI